MKEIEEFRRYLISLEDFYMNEHIRINGHKRLPPQPEERMSLLCGHILKELDERLKGEGHETRR